jgi:tetratricopeptide (TPR) repeat protein
MRGALDNMFENETSGLGVVMLDGKAGPALAISEQEARALVARIIERSRQSPATARNAARRRIMPFVIGAVMATSAAAASYQRGWGLPWPNAAKPEAASVVPLVAPSPPAPPKRVAPPRVEAEPELVPEAVPLPAPRLDKPAAAPALARKPPQPAPEAVAEDGLSRANSLRGQGRYADALTAYLAVVQGHPRSRQAQAARVAAAALELERFGNAASAERLYTQAAESGSELAAEARFGIAETHRARGDAARERAALRSFLEKHPESPLAAAARRRLESLDRR